jgi:septum site-determining protein MinD
MSNCKIISCYSFRDGTGKSSVLANLAVAMSKKKKIAIIDANFAAPGIDRFFLNLLGRNHPNLEINYTFNDYLWERFSVQKIFPYQLDQNLYLIPASSKFGDVAKTLDHPFDEQKILEGIYQLIDELKLDYLLIDTSPSLTPENRLFLAVSDLLTIVIRPDRQDFQETTFTLEIAQKIGLKKNYLILNQVAPNIYNINPDDLTTEIHTYFRRQACLIGVLPQSEKLKNHTLPERLQLLQNNELNPTSGLLYLDEPDDIWSKEIDKICQTLLKK